MSQTAAERMAEKRSHPSEENGNEDSNEAVAIKLQKIDTKEAEAVVNDTPKTKVNDSGAPVVKNVEDVGAENDVDEDDGGDIEESSNAESGVEDEEGDVDDEEEDGLGGEDDEDDLECGEDDEDGEEEEEEE